MRPALQKEEEEEKENNFVDVDIYTYQLYLKSSLMMVILNKLFFYLKTLESNRTNIFLNNSIVHLLYVLELKYEDCEHILKFNVPLISKVILIWKFLELPTRCNSDYGCHRFAIECLVPYMILYHTH